MTVSRMFLALGALALVGGCEARVGKDDEGQSAAAGAGSVEGKAEEGSFSIKAPGVDMKIDIPESMAKDLDVDSDSDLAYPGATLSGMHVEGGNQKDTGSKGAVELRFTSPDAPEKLVAWYRDPARAKKFTVRSARQEGGATLIAGEAGEERNPFTLRISAKQGGGSEARLALTDRS